MLRARLDTIQADKHFAVGFFRCAADPQSPLSPFSAESARARELAITLYAEAVHGATSVKMPPELRDSLPELLWPYQMGICVRRGCEQGGLTRRLVS